MSFSAVIRFIDRGGIRTGSVIQPIPAAAAPTTAKLATLSNVLYAHINAGIESYSVLEWIEAAVTGAVAAATGTNCDKALINYAYIDGAGDTRYNQLWIPNPDVATHFELVEGVGFRLLAATATLLEVALSVAIGFPVQIVEGKLEYRERDPGAGNKTASSLKFEDEFGNIAYMAVPLVASAAALATFGGALNTIGITKSKLNRAAFLDEKTVLLDPATAPGTPNTTGDWGCVETRAILRFAYMENTQKKTMRLSLPAVMQTDCEVKKGKRGWKFKKASGDVIASALTTFFGASVRTLRFTGSQVDVKDLDPQ